MQCACASRACVARRETCVGDVNVAVSSRASSRYSALSVVVSVTDINDHPPRFSPTSALTVNVSETAPPGKTVALPSASDDDAGENARLSYEVHQLLAFLHQCS